ncbi:DUF6221 family protein [Nocardia tengchongensis]|uniref:DUF6221 family protein n=1 Tax=Nocardia tengchongensis TaxID=2055889 RepID=UPI0036627AAA
MTIEEFIEARIAEDERAAKAATQGDWFWDGRELVIKTERLHASQTVIGVSGYDAELEIGAPDVAHIARHDPARVLRQCAALRAIAGRHEAKNWEWYEDSRCLRMVSGVICEECSGDIGDVLWPCEEIRALAAIWSDHPDY